VIPVIVLVAMILLLILLLWWLLLRTEGVYLGKRVVIWLYDVYASRYDSIVQLDMIEEHLQLAAPIMQRLESDTHPLVLDVATGTGRVPLALCHHARFEGHIAAVDLSRKMLQQATNKIQAEHFEDYVTLIWADGMLLPFDDNSFDVVTCMAALEFMPQPDYGLHELVRVLRPGGILLTTRRINEKLMPGKLWTETQMRQLLSETGINNIGFEDWLVDYAKVWGQKIGSSEFIGASPLDGMLRCSCCAGYMVHEHDVWRCEQCHTGAPVLDGIIELQAMDCKQT
jgi:ubiquinone/menaquinone biosynthesis C-methylase UbiE